METVGNVIGLMIVAAIVMAVAPIGIWTEISRSRRAAERRAKEQMEELKKIENAIKLCANFLSRG